MLNRSKFRNDKHIAQWEMTFKTYCQPIRSMRLNEIDTEAVFRVLQPIWAKIPETASRLRGRIENILDAAKARGFQVGENPANWRGHLKTLLPARRKLHRGHHAALPYDDLPAFMAELRTQESLGVLALELTILSVCRTSEVLKANWAEFDLGKKAWTIPAERMKAGIEHRIPLADRVITILKKVKRLASRAGYVLPGNKLGKPLSNMAMAAVLKRMGRDSTTVHGFWSTFSDFVSEQTLFSHETREHALAHRISDKAEASYRRGDQFEKRRKLMEVWATYCPFRLLGAARATYQDNLAQNALWPTLNLETREAQFVLEGVQGKVPAYCPTNAYWAQSAARIVNCGDGTIYDLRETTKVGIAGAFALIPNSDPSLGTPNELGPNTSKYGPETNSRYSEN